jgi:hypothetical protein
MRGLLLACVLFTLLAPGCDLPPRTEDPTETLMKLRGTEWHACVMREYRTVIQTSDDRYKHVNLAFSRCKIEKKAFEMAARPAANAR